MSNSLKTCPTRFPGARSASLRPELPEWVLKVNSCSSTGFNLHRGREQMPLLFIVDNALGTCQFVVDTSTRVSANQSALLIRWPKYWSFSFSISPSSEYPGLISFKIDWFDLLAVQGSLKSLLEHHSSKASVLWHLVFFISGKYSEIRGAVAGVLWEGLTFWVDGGRNSYYKDFSLKSKGTFFWDHRLMDSETHISHPGLWRAD